MFKVIKVQETCEEILNVLVKKSNTSQSFERSVGNRSKYSMFQHSNSKMVLVF